MSSRREETARGLASCVAVGLLGLGVACGGSGGAAADVDGPEGGVGSSSSGLSSGGTPGGNVDGGGGSSGGGGGDGSAAFDSATPGDSDGKGGNEGGEADGGSLDPNVAPGGNFDLSLWELQEPVGSPAAPTTILPAQLEGPNGYHDTYFFTDPTDGSMSFWDPENGVTTANSSYPRSELREMTGRRRRRELDADRHQHAERDAQGDARPGPRRGRADPPRHRNPVVHQAAARALLLLDGLDRHGDRADARPAATRCSTRSETSRSARSGAT